MKLHQGICDVETIKQLDSKQAKLVVCNPVHMPHVRGTTREHCNFCGTSVWLAGSTAQSVPAAVTVYLACWNCMHELFPNHTAQMPTRAQAEDLAEATGIPVDDVKKTIDTAVTLHNRAQRFKNN